MSSHEFEVFLRFYRDCDHNGSMNWTISNVHIEMNCNYNSEIDLSKMLQRLNFIAKEVGLETSGWKCPFVVCITKPPVSITDFSGSIIFKTNK